jgi:ABC-type glucose/galactose transport system permease subunit
MRYLFDFSVVLLLRMVPYAAALNVRMWKLMVNALPEPEYLTTFTEECCSLTQNFFILMHFTLTYLHCYVVLPTYFVYVIYESLSLVVPIFLPNSEF